MSEEGGAVWVFPSVGDRSGAASARRDSPRRVDVRVVCGLGLLAVLLVLGYAGPCLVPSGVDLGALRRPPSAAHWLGTTPAGRDMCAVTLHGMRASLVGGLLVAVSATGLAAVAGTVAGYRGGWADQGLTCAAELLLVLPPLFVVAIVAPALHGAYLPVLAAFMWMVTARAVRGATLSLRDREYVLAARYLGVHPVRIIVRHIVPHLASLLIADTTLNVGTAVIAETSLSYLGLGARPPNVTLGTTLAAGAPSAGTFPWLFLPSVTALALILVGVNLTADGLRDTLDPATPR